jgi:hypothetical protein
VAKISLDPRDNKDREIYFKDVEMQTLAKFYAKQFNGEWVRELQRWEGE